MCTHGSILTWLFMLLFCLMHFFCKMDKSASVPFLYVLYVKIKMHYFLYYFLIIVIISTFFVCKYVWMRVCIVMYIRVIMRVTSKMFLSSSFLLKPWRRWYEVELNWTKSYITKLIFLERFHSWFTPKASFHIERSLLLLK